jgi:hypothetical protein
MPNPCQPFEYNQNNGPYRVGLRLTLPKGYADRGDPGGGGIPATSEVHDALWTAFDAKPAEVTERLPGFESTTVWIGTDRVFNGAPIQPDDPTKPDTPADPLIWYVQTWVYAPYAPSNRSLDYPWLAGRWVAEVATLELPNSHGTMGLAVTTVVYQAGPDQRFVGVLPPNYPDASPPPPAPRSDPGPDSVLIGR